MKKQTILGLAVCALSFGAVAGVLSTRAVTETNAVTSNYYLHGQYAGSWDWRDLDLEHDDVKDEYYVTGLQLQDWAAFGFKQKDVSASWWSWSILEDEVKTGGNFQDKDGNIQVKEGKGGYYDIYFKLTDSVPSSIWIGENTSVVEHNVTEWIVTDGVKAGSSNVVKVADGGVPAASGAGYGQTFDGWFTDEACTSAFSGTVTSDITLYGKVTSVTTTETYHIDVSAVSAFATPYYYVWDASGSKAAWPGEAATGVSAGKFDLTVKSSTQGLIITDGAASGTKQTVDITTLDDGETITVLDEKDDGGKYKVNITGAAAPTIANGAYLVGSHNEWAQDDDSKTETPNEGDHGKWSNVTLAANVEFKIVIGDGTTESWLGFDSIGDDKSKVGFHKNTEEGDSNNNIVVDTAGTYNIFLNGENKIYISSNAPAPTHADYYAHAKLGENDWADFDMAVNPENDQEWVWSNVTLAVGDLFGFKINGDEGWYNTLEEGGASADFEIVENNIRAKVAATYDFYFKTDSKQVYVSKQGGEPVADTYTGTVGGVAMALTEVPVESAYDGENCLKKFQATVTAEANAQLAFSKNGAAITSNIGPTEGCNCSNDLKIVTGGTGIIVQLKVYAEGYAVYVSAPADADLTAVRNFVATYIDGPAAEDYTTIEESARAAKCDAKYVAAKAALDALTGDQQSLFNSDAEFTNARATLAVWKAVHDSLSGAKSISSPMSGSNMTAIIVGSVMIAGVALAGAMAFFSHKRKSEK